MTPLRTVALLAAMLLAVLAVAWPFGWPKAMSARSVTSYAAATLLGIGVAVLFPYGHGPNVPFFGMIALVAWILLAVLWLIRRNPQIPNPDWTKTPWSVADWGLIVIIVASGLAAALN